MAAFGSLETSVEPFAGLLRDHLYAHDLVSAAREAVEESMRVPGEPGQHEAMERLRDLAAYLDVDLPVHIAKEEEVLFPALRELAGTMPQVVGEMVEQHDEVRLRAAKLGTALLAVEEAHPLVDAARARLVSLAGAAVGHPSASLGDVHDALKRLDWILQGHFGDEEDDLFAPALQLLTSEACAHLAAAAAALEI
jgi:hypothetical protein